MICFVLFVLHGSTICVFSPPKLVFLCNYKSGKIPCDREQINGGILPSVQLQLRLDLAGVREENGQSEAVHQAGTELLAVNTNIADNVETSPKHSLPLHTKTLLIRLVCQHLG